MHAGVEKGAKPVLYLQPSYAPAPPGLTPYLRYKNLAREFEQANHIEPLVFFLTALAHIRHSSFDLHPMACHEESGCKIEMSMHP